MLHSIKPIQLLSPNLNKENKNTLNFPGHSYLKILKDSSNQKQKQNSSECKLIVEVVAPIEGLQYEFENQDDEEIEEWHLKFQDYDMDSDKENMPQSENDEDPQFDSDQGGYSDEEKETTIQSDQKIFERKSPAKNRLSSALKLEKELEEIKQVEESSNTNAFEVSK